MYMELLGVKEHVQKIWLQTKKQEVMKKTLILFLSVMCLSSCVEDEGNYNYTELNKLTIEGLEESYNVLHNVDTIKIQPIITSTILGENLDNYEYQWHIHEGIGEHKHTVISKEKDLVYPVDIKIGTYDLYFTVLDKTTGIKTMASAPMKVTTPTSKGFLLLGDDLEEGIMGLDMVIMPAGRDTSVMANAYDNSETRLKGADRILYQGPRYNDTQSLWMCTDDGSFRMNNKEDISIISELNDFGMIEIANSFEIKRPMRIMDVFPHPTTTNRSGMNRGYMTEDVCVYAAIGSAEYFGTPVNRVNANTKKLFKFYPLAFMGGCVNNNYLGYAIIYNKDDNSFMYLGNYTAYATALTDKAGDPFPWKQENRTIVWGGNSVNGTHGSSFTIMKELDAEEYYLYKFKAGPYNYNTTKEGAWKIDLSKAENFEKASHYAVSGTGSILMYAYGSTLYLYDYAYGDMLSEDMHGEITHLDIEYCSTGSRTAFVVATYNDTDKGIVRKLDVGTDPNKLEIIHRPKEVWHTRLRVKDVEWKKAY